MIKDATTDERRKHVGEIVEPVEAKTPAAILREQAVILNQLTRSLLIGSVEHEPTTNNTLIYTFSITAPAINNHKFLIPPCNIPSPFIP